MERAVSHTKFATTLRDERRWPDEKMQVAAKQVADLIEHPGWGVVRQLLQDLYDGLEAQFVRSSTILSHQQYANLAGEMAGLQAALDAAQVFVTIAGERDAALELSVAANNGEEPS